MTRRVSTYSYALGFAFWASLLGVLAVRQFDLPSATKLAPLLALAIAGEELVVLQQQRSGGNILSFSAAAHVAAAIVVGPTAAALVAASAVVIVDGLRREAFPYVVINSAMFGGAIWIAGAAFAPTVTHGGTLHASALPALVALVVVRYLLTSAVFAGGTALATGSRFAYVLRAAVVEEIGSAIGEGSLGVMVAIALTRHDWVLLPFLLPLLAALYRSKATLSRLQLETDAALQSVAAVIDERDPTTSAHSERVAQFVGAFASAIHLPRREADRLVAAARFHDLGKIAVDVATLTKEGRLTDAEMRNIRSHPRLSARLLAPFQFARDIAGFVELHHERYDGRGYFSVPGAEIPVESHVLIVADSFDAMTSARPYRPALSIEEAAQELEDKAGTQFHPQVALAFAALVRGRSVTAAIGSNGVDELRRAFAGVPTVELPPLSSFLQPRLVAVFFAVATLVLVGIHGVPLVAIACCGGVAVAAALFSTAVAIRRRRGATRAREALARGAGPSSALAAAGIKAWTAWLRPVPDSGSYEPFVADLGAPAEAVSELCRWALRRHRYTEVALASGGVLFLSPPVSSMVRLAIVVPNTPSLLRRRVVRDVLERAVDTPPALDANVRTPDRRRRWSGGGLRIVLDVELNVFETVRRSAGQLLAEQVVADTEDRLRSMLRSSDAVVRVGDDRFALSVAVPDDGAATMLRDRVRRELSSVPVPSRVPRVEPRVAIADTDDPELAGLEAELERHRLSARAVS